jgi:hypothetical protein
MESEIVHWCKRLTATTDNGGISSCAIPSLIEAVFKGWLVIKSGCSIHYRTLSELSRLKEMGIGKSSLRK